VLPAAEGRPDVSLVASQDNVFYNTYGFGKDSNKMDKEFGDFKDMFFNAAEQVRRSGPYA
jgi:hypothetical protein